jgi:hypothetical protein
MDPRATSEKFQSIVALVKADHSALESIQSDIDTYGFSDAQLHEIYLTAVKGSLNELRHVPKECIDEEIWLAVIKHESIKSEPGDSSVFRDLLNHEIPFEKLTYNIIVELCKRDLDILEFVKGNPDKLKEITDQPFVDIYTDVIKGNWCVKILS